MRQRFPWPIDDIREMYEGGKSLQEIADILGSNQWQPYWKKHLGRSYRPNQKVVNKVAKRSGIALRGRGAPLARNGFWNGGRSIDKSGYILVKSPGHPSATKAGYVREHRLVMEKLLGRYLTETEVVHHKDDDPSNNDPSNLLLFDTNSIHIAVTMKGRVESTRTTEARRTIAQRRVEWWPTDLLNKWYVVDRLSLRAIASLIDVSETGVSLALRRMGLKIVEKRSNHGTTAEQRAEAGEFLATHPHPRVRDARRSR